MTATTLLLLLLLLLLILLLSDSSHIGFDAMPGLFFFLFCERYMFRIVDSFCVCKKMFWIVDFTVLRYVLDA